MAQAAFDRVAAVGLTLPGVDAAVKYDGSPVLRLGGCFLAGLATHQSAEPDTLVVRVDPEERELLLHEAPDVYYVTDYYRPHPVVLVRLSRVDDDVLRELLAMSWRLTAPKSRWRLRDHRPGRPTAPAACGGSPATASRSSGAPRTRRSRARGARARSAG